MAPAVVSDQGMLVVVPDTAQSNAVDPMHTGSFPQRLLGARPTRSGASDSEPFGGQNDAAARNAHTTNNTTVTVTSRTIPASPSWDALSVRLDLVSGWTRLRDGSSGSRVRYVPRRPGRRPGRCDNYCSHTHPRPAVSQHLGKLGLIGWSAATSAACSPNVFYIFQSTGRVHLCIKVSIDDPACTVGDWDLGPIGARGKPAATMNCEGKMHVFVVGYGNHLFTKWQIDSGSVVWSDWFDLGGYLTSKPDAYINYQNRLEIFARGGDNAVWTRWQTFACGSWSSWTPASVNSIVDFPKIRSWDPNGYVKLSATGQDYYTWNGIRPCWTCPWQWVRG